MMRNDGQPADGERVSLRDLDRIREKVTIRIEPRHAVLASLGGVALLCAAFAIGVLVGRSCEPAERAPSGPKQPGAPLATQAAPIPAPQRSSVRRHQVLPRPVEARGPSLEPLTAWTRRGPDDVPLPPQARPMADDSAWPVLAVSDPCAGYSCAALGCAEPTLESPAQWAREAVRSTQDRFRRAHALVVRLATLTTSLPPRLVLHALRSLPAVAVASPTPLNKPSATSGPVTLAPAAPLPSGWFTVQVRSYRDEALAREFAASLRSEGYTVEVVRHEDDAGQTWYRVRVGRFPSVPQARDFARRLNERTGDQAIVMAMEAR